MNAEQQLIMIQKQASFEMEKDASFKSVLKGLGGGLKKLKPSFVKGKPGFFAGLRDFGWNFGKSKHLAEGVSEDLVKRHKMMDLYTEAGRKGHMGAGKRYKKFLDDVQGYANKDDRFIKQFRDMKKGIKNKNIADAASDKLQKSIRDKAQWRGTRKGTSSAGAKSTTAATPPTKQTTKAAPATPPTKQTTQAAQPTPATQPTKQTTQAASPTKQTTQGAQNTTKQTTQGAQNTTKKTTQGAQNTTKQTTKGTKTTPIDPDASGPLELVDVMEKGGWDALTSMQKRKVMKYGAMGLIAKPYLEKAVGLD